jgi:hypothetical protein
MDTKARLLILINLFALAIVRSQINQCAKWTCGSVTNGTCGQSAIAINATFPSVNVDAVCAKTTQYCDVLTGLDKVYSQPRNDYHCQNVTTPTPPMVYPRYPGEDCTNNTDCYTPIVAVANYSQNCTANKCLGFTIGQNTTDPFTCTSGTYLDKTSGQCQTQKALNCSCATTWECQNQYGCYNKTCRILFELSLNTTVDPKLFDLPTTGILCESGETNAAGTYCINNDYVDTTNVDSIGFKPCNMTDKCSYTNGESLACVCGINSKGQGYCERPSSRGILFLIIFRS